MKFDSSRLGPQEFGDEDRAFRGVRYADVKKAMFLNAYYDTWGCTGEPPLPVYAVTFGRLLRGFFPGGALWKFKQAAARTLDSHALLRWGADRRGFRRLLHPNGITLFGRWIIDQTSSYSGYFQAGKEALVVARYSTCCSETRRGYYRSLALVGHLFPTVDPDHEELLPTASFITQEDLGGNRTTHINDAILRNAPNTSPWRRGLDLPILLLTGFAFLRVDQQPTVRQLYEIAELGASDEQPTDSPNFMQLTVDSGQPRIAGECIDFRDEILEQIYDRGVPTAMRKLIFNIEVTDEAKTYGKLVQRRRFSEWNRLGRIEFTEAVASYNSDFVLHFHHPPWRNDRNDPQSIVRHAIR